MDQLMSGVTKEPLQGIALWATPLVFLADLTGIAQRTVLQGGAFYLDVLTLCPGIHRQNSTDELSKGELPACAALTSGYVFRIENPATVNYLQRNGSAGAVTTIAVSRNSHSELFTLPSLLVSITHLLTMSALAILLLLQDRWAVGMVLQLVLCRLLNVIVIRKRTHRGGLWKGASEPGEKADLLVLASQDRWFRIQGLVDDVKAVTSGQWLADPTFLEGSLISISQLLLYLSLALATNCSQSGSIILVALALASAGLLALANSLTNTLQMHGFSLRISKQPKQYARRRDLAEELIKETGRRDWAVSLAMVPPGPGDHVQPALM